MRPYLALLAMLVPVAVAAGSCALRGFTIEGGGGSSSSATSSSSGVACGVTFPDPPTMAAPGGNVEFTAAVHSINFGDISMAGLGLDLDQKCTCFDAGPSCQSPHMTVICDDNEGRDNQGAKLFSTLATFLPGFSSSTFSSQAHDGHWSLLLRIRNYNDQPDDAQVEVTWYVSPGFRTNPLTDGGKPAWDGNDEWNVSSASVNNMDLDQPLYQDKNAYVSGGMLVASLPTVDIVVSGGTSNTVTLHFVGAGVLAKIEPAVHKLTGGQLVGRWTTSDVFKTLGSYRDNNGMGICSTSPFYGAGKSAICNSADILASPGTPATPCDSLSMGIGFTADPAQLPNPMSDGGILNPPPPSPSGCPDSGDPSTDNCL